MYDEGLRLTPPRWVSYNAQKWAIPGNSVNVFYISSSLNFSFQSVGKDAGRLYTKEILDYEKSCRPTLRRLTDVDDVKFGDHIHWLRAGSWRDGIVVDVQKPDNQAPIVLVIRYSYEFPRFYVKLEPWDIDFRKNVYRFDYGEYCHPPTLVVARAKACIGQIGYNALRNNNDDFCRWCKAGKHTYLCINETLMCTDVDLESKSDDGTHLVLVGSMDELNQGDHIAWTPLYVDRPSVSADDDGWSHGIVIDVEPDEVEIIGYNDAQLAIGKIPFSEEKFMDYKVHRIVYEHCHMLDEVFARVQSMIGVNYLPDERPYFARWAKTGKPVKAEAVETVLIEPKKVGEPDDAQEEDQSFSLDNEATKTGARAGATSLARGVEGAAAAGATTAVKQGSRVLVRGAAEGAAAAAAVGVEAVVLAVEVGLTYRHFNRCEISKDELQKRHIQNTSRSVGAAAAGVGGGMAGAAIGTLAFPGIGTIVGGIVGGIIGGVTGQVGGHFAGKGIAFAAERPYDALFVENIVKTD